MWQNILQKFGGGPDIKCNCYYDKEKEKKYIDLLIFIQIHCIFFNKKNKLNQRENDNKVYLTNFDFFCNKNMKVHEVIECIKNSLEKENYKEKDKYQFWIDINYNNTEKIEKYFTNNINSLLDKNKINQTDLIDENLKLKIKLCPLNLFNEERIINIFPNFLTDNFDTINKEKLKQYNNELEQNILDKDKEKLFLEFPKISIIIETEKKSIFNPRQNLKYKLGKKCSNSPNCQKKTILTYFCNCEKVFYCSKECQIEHKTIHIITCDILLRDYFKTMNLSNKQKKESPLGLVGIKNLGNTCYMNTAIQCLSNCPELRNYFLFINIINNINTKNILGYNGTMALAFEFIIKKLWYQKDNNICEPEKFKYAISLCNDHFKGNSQQDTHEFLIFLIDSLHEDLNKVNDKKYIEKEERDLSDELKSKIEWNNILRRNQSIIIDLFYGLFKSTVTCSNCNKSFISFNAFSSLSVELKKKEKEKNNNINQNTNNNKSSTENKENNNNKENNENKENKKNNNENKGNNNKEIYNDNKENKENNNKINILNNINDKINLASQKIKEGSLVGGKSHQLNENCSSPLTSQKSNNICEKGKIDDELEKIYVTFIPYFDRYITICLQIPIYKSEFKKDLKYILFKISKILKKDIYSLYLYYKKENDSILIYDTVNKVFNSNKIVLFVTEIKPSIMSDFNCEGLAPMFLNKNNPFYSSVDSFEEYLNTNKEEIKNYLTTNLYTNSDKNPESDKIIKEFQEIKNEYLKNHKLKIEKLQIFILKDIEYIEENNQKREEMIFNPKIFLAPKEKSIIELYKEIFHMNSNIIHDSITDYTNINKKNDKNEVFKNLFINSNQNKMNLPFKLCIELKNKKNEILLPNQPNKYHDIKEILKINNFNEKDQIILKVFWSKNFIPSLKNLKKTNKINYKFIEDKKLSTDIKSNNHEIKVGSNDPNLNFCTEKKVKNSMCEHYLKIGNDYKKQLEEEKKEKEKKEKEEQKENGKKNISEDEISTAHTVINKIKKEDINLTDCIEFLGEEEILDGDDIFFCERCKNKFKSTKKLEIYNIPKILIIQIKRFNNNSKINTKVNFPLYNLDLSKYVLSFEKIKTNNINFEAKYDLFAVANHYGSLIFGHYTAYCKNSLNNKWYEFNDSVIKEIKEDDIVTPNAYVLFYKQKGINRLNWEKIYNKKYINIDVNNSESLKLFEDDFKSENIRKNDKNQYDMILLEKSKELKINNNILKNGNENNKENQENENNQKENSGFLGKKRSSPGIKN